uniref:Reverse transcriptase domain-containing protein n=1 Tax=Tanacetum cinerariifolium TaxID=118510 RepID=A0A6L2L3E7_TANCI|nr:reverse transcriptase domain-containing protein [Tanacetum cinerariifolium]
MLRACPHHRFTELIQIDTFYNGLNENDKDSLNAAAGGNLVSKTTREALHIIKNKSKVRYSRNKPNVSRMITTSKENASKTDDRIDKLADQISTLVDIVSKKVVTPTTVKAVEESCVTCGGNHAYYNCDATNRNQSSVCTVAVVDFEADPRVPLILGRSFLRTDRALIDVYEEEITLRVNDEAVNFNLNQTTRYSSTYDDMSITQIDIIDVAREEYAQKTLGIEAYLKDDSLSLEINHADCDPEGDIFLIENLLNDDPFQLPPMDLKQGEVVKVKSLIEEPPDLELKYLPSHLEYAYLEGVDKLPVIIAKDLKVDEKEALLKKGGITGVENENNELIPTRLVTGNEFYCFLDVFSGYFQIPINPPDQEKTTFTCPYGTFAYRRMPFSLCNAPGTFQRYTMAIFHDMIEKTMEVFMDDFSVFGSFSSCLSYLDTMLQRCEDTNLVLNWEKYHFKVIEGIVLGHKISKNGLEVDRAKVDVIAKLPHPTIVKEASRKSYESNGEVFQIFQDLHFDISFADALLLMPKFASTIKSLLANKDKLFELAKILLNENFSAMLLKKLPKKLGDPDKFLIPWDRSITRPKGVTEDVFVKVGKFYFPTGFVVVDFEVAPRVPLIIGRSFLRTGRALIDVYGEEITLRVNDEAVTFILNQTTRYSSTYDDMSVNRINVIDVAREEYAQEILEEIEAYLKDESISLKIDHPDYDPEEDICLIEKLLNDDPFQLPLM